MTKAGPERPKRQLQPVREDSWKTFRQGPPRVQEEPARK